MQALYRYNLWTGLYMLDPWEKALFNTVVLGATAMTVYYSYTYLAPLLSGSSGAAAAPQ